MNVQAIFPILKSSKRKGAKQMHKLIIQTKDLTKTYGEQTVVDVYKRQILEPLICWSG